MIRASLAGAHSSRMEGRFPASLLVVAGLLRVAGASRSEPSSSYTTDQSSLEEGLVTATGHLVPIKEDDATQVTLQFDSFTSDSPNDGISHPHEIIRMEAKEILKGGSQPLTFPDRQPRRSQLPFLEGVLGHQIKVPSTSRPLNSTNVLSGLSKMVAESASQPEPLTTLLPREDRAENGTGHDLSISGKQSSLVPTEAAEIDLSTTLLSESSESAGQKMTMDSSPSLASSPGSPHTFTLGKNTTKSEVLDETTLTPVKEGLGKSLRFLPTGSQQPLVNGEQIQPGLRTSEIPKDPGLLAEAQLNFSDRSQRWPLPEGHVATQQPNFASSPHGKTPRHKAVGLQKAENPALLTPSQILSPSSLFLLIPETLSSGSPPLSATPGGVSRRDQPISIFQSQFSPSSKPGMSDEAEKHLQESRHLTLQHGNSHQRTIQPSHFKLAQITAALQDPLSVPKAQETTRETSVPTQEKPQLSTMLATVYGEAQGNVLSTSPLGKATSSLAHPTMLRMAASSHVQPLLPAMLDAPERITQGISKTLLPSTFPPLVHGQRASLSTSAPPLTESALSASASASVPTKPQTPGISATVMLGMFASLHTALQHESEQLSTGTPASILVQLPTLGSLASAYAGPNSSAATDSAHSTPTLAGLSTRVHSELQGRAFGMPFQVEHQTLGNSVSTHNRPTVPKTNVSSPVEAGTAATGLSVPATAVHDRPKPHLSADISRPFYAMTELLPTGVDTRLQPATPSVHASSPQVLVLRGTLPTRFKPQTPGASTSFIKDPHLLVTPVYSQAKLNTTEVQPESNLPVSAEASASIPTCAKAPQVLSVHAQTQHPLSPASTQLGTKPLAHGGTQTPNAPASSPVQLLGHLRPQPSSMSVSVQAELLPQAGSTSAEAAAPNPKGLSAVHPTRQRPAAIVLPRMHYTTVKEEEGKSSLQSSLPAPQPGTDSPPLPGVSASRASRKAEGRDQSSAAPHLGSPASQTVHRKNGNLPILSSVRTADPFPGMRTTPILAGAEVQDLMQSAQGFTLHLFNQSDVTVDGNLDSAVASSYLGIPSSLPYLSFLIRSAENMICLQPIQNTTPPSGEPNVSRLGVTSFQEMLLSSTFLGLSHPGASRLVQMSASRAILVKPMFVFLPADEPGDLVLHAAEEEKEHTDSPSFTKAAVLGLVASSYEQRAESNPTLKQSTRAKVLPTSRQVIPGPVLSSLPEYTTGSSRVRSTTSKAALFPDWLREIATTRTKSLESRDQEEGFLSSILDPPKSEKNNMISLSVEHQVSATLPMMMVSVHQRRKILPSTTELLNSSSPRVTSLHSMMEHSASPMLARTSRSEPQLNTTVTLHTEDRHAGSITPITSSHKNSGEPLSVSSAGNTDLPLEAAKHLTPLRAALHRFLITNVFPKHPSEIQYMPSTVSDFLTFSTVRNLTKSAAVNYAYSEAVPALPRTIETSSYFVNSAVAEVSKSHLLSPIPTKASERPNTPPSPTLFLGYAQAPPTPSAKHLEDINLQVHSRPPVSMSSQVSTNSYFAPSTRKDNQANLMLTGRASLTSTEGQIDTTVSIEETGENVRLTEIHSPGEAIHFTPTRLSTDPAFSVSTESSSVSISSGGTVGSTGLQREIHKFPLTTFHSLSPSSTRKDTSSSPIGGKVPPLEMPHSDLHSLRLSETAATSEVVFFSTLAAEEEEEEVTQHVGGQKAGVAPPFPTSSRLYPQPARLERGHQDGARRLNYKQKQDSGSFMPSPGNTSSSLGSSTPAFLATILSSGVPSDGPVDKVLNQTSRLRSLPLDIAEVSLTLHTQVLLTLESLSEALEVTAGGDFMAEATTAGEFDESYLHTVGEQATVVMDTTEVLDTTEEAAKDPLAVLQQSEANSSLLDWKIHHHRRLTRSDNVFLDGFAIVSDDTCGSGNYTTEMSLHRSMGQLTARSDSFRALIVLQSNSHGPTLRVKSCCVTPTTRPTGPDAACCLFPRTPLGCKHVQLHRNSKPQAASFTIQPFQMLNCSVAYLHCELSICLSNRAGCEQSCSEDRDTSSQPSGQSSYQTLHNLISFGPILKVHPGFPSELAAEFELAMMFPVLLGSLAGMAILLGISVFIWFYWRHKIRMAAKPGGEGLCTP